MLQKTGVNHEKRCYFTEVTEVTEAIMLQKTVVNHEKYVTLQKLQKR